MALYAMSDLHLSLSADKPMDVFGSSWHNYMERIRTHWSETVTDADMVIVGGDISWAMYLEEAYEDFKFLNELPGKKLLLRGNHDYWWEGISKLKNYMASNGFDSVCFLQNDAYVWDNTVIAGTRGWLIPSSDSFSSDDRKIYERELIRLDLSLKSAQKLAPDMEKLAVFHFPPLKNDGSVDGAISEILHSYNVTRCIYGHLHGIVAQNSFSGIADGIEYKLVSADYLNFKPCNPVSELF